MNDCPFMRLVWTIAVTVAAIALCTWGCGQ